MKDLEKILNKLNDIEYGFLYNNKNICDEEDINFNEFYHLQSPMELIKNKYGVCWDQVELERYYLQEENIKSSSFFIIAYDNKQEPTHTFITVKLDKYYWLEHSWEPYRGIHAFDSLEELLNDVKNKFEKSLKRQKVKNYEIAIYEYKKPNYNLNCLEFMNYCEHGKKINL